MLARAVEAGVPAGWVTADEVYGGDARLRAFMEDHDLAYVLAVKATQPLWAAGEQGPAEVAARQLVAGLPARRSAWTTTRSAAMTPGIGTPAWCWSPRRSWRWSAPTPPERARGAAERAELPQPLGSDLIRVSTAEARRLLVGLVWWTPPSLCQVLWWSRWRRRHQARARRCHWHRRNQRLAGLTAAVVA
jgi:hypothetical protein